MLTPKSLQLYGFESVYINELPREGAPNFNRKAANLVHISLTSLFGPNTRIVTLLKNNPL